MSVQQDLAAKFYALEWPARLTALMRAGWLTQEDGAELAAGRALLQVQGADRMVENVVGVMGLPLAVALNMVVDGKRYVTPMAVEEPSIVAALSAAAKVIARCGGFTTTVDESLIVGQIQVTDVADAQAAASRVVAAKEALMAAARQAQPNMVARGGGIRDVTAEPRGTGDRAMVVVQLWVDTRDAMGANAVNTLCEALAPEVARIAEGEPGLRILSNLCSRALVTARCVLTPDALAHKSLAGTFVRNQVVAASHMAEVDVFRAATHNKGIMNGIDAVAVATGNDWRAIEAGAHAWAGRGEGYHPLSRWHTDAQGRLVGTLCLPLKVGIVGGNFLANPGVALALRLVNVPSATALARLMAAVGLAQNFAALKALGTVGIQSGHMALHARSVVASTGVSAEHFEAAVHKLLQSKNIKLDHARAIVAELERDVAAGHLPKATPGQLASAQADEALGEGFGKLIVLGEHAVVYNSHALAVPLMLATQVVIGPRAAPNIRLRIPAWNIDALMPQAMPEGQADAEPHGRLYASIRLLVGKLNLAGRPFEMTVHAHVPRAMGLGSSAAFAVATVRALSRYFKLDLPESAVIELAFLSEQLAHGTPSGVDNALATMGSPLLFRRGPEGPTHRAQAVGAPLHWVVGLTHEESLTATTVRAVRGAHQEAPSVYQRVFDHIDALTLEASDAMARGDVTHLGRLMNINHGLLHGLGVTTLQLETLVAEARAEGALGAKVTGGGGGGSMLALCADRAMQERLVKAFARLGYTALCATTPSTPPKEDHHA